MDFYLLNCECGAAHQVTPRQAGSTITCRCKVLLDVPRLGELRNLPRVNPQESAGKSVSAWSPNMGFIALGLTIVVLASIVLLVIQLNIPKSPAGDLDAKLLRLEESLKNMKDEVVFQSWIAMRTHSGGKLLVIPTPNIVAYEKQLATLRRIQMIVASVAGIGLAIAFAGFLWSSSSKD